MKQSYFSKAAYTLSVMVILALAAAPWSGQSAAPKAAVSVVSDDVPGLGARHGLKKLSDTLKARGVSVAQTSSLEAARSETLIVADRAAASGAAVESNVADHATRRAAFLKLIDRPRAPLSPEVKELGATEGLAQTHFTFAADAEQRVPGILVKRANSVGRRPVVVALHGTGGNKESQLALLKELAGLGFIGVAIDGRYHGARTSAGKGSSEYNEAILRAYRNGRDHPFLYDTVWDVLRLIDYLETRADVDAKRIGLIGFSKGGMETYLASAVDPRVAVAVPCIGVQSFRWALENNAWQSRVETFQSALNGAAKDAGVTEINADFVRKLYDRVVPGVYKEFDGPEMLPLIAPRPLLVINGDSDPRTPMPGVMECATHARQAYANAQAEDKFQLLIQEKTGHAVTPASRQAAIAWFMKWLKP